MTLQLEKKTPTEYNVNVFGRNPSIGATYETVWDAGGLYTFISAAETLSVVSSTPLDASGGPGAIVVTIEGLNANFDEISEDVAMDGVTPVLTTKAFLRVNKAFVKEVGTVDGGNAGDITFTTTTGGVVLAAIVGGRGGAAGTATYGLGTTQQAVFTVPTGWTAYLLHFSSYTPSAVSAPSIQLYHRDAADSTSATKLLFESTDFIAHSAILGVLPKFKEKSDIWIQAASASLVMASAEFSLVLVPNPRS